MSLFPEFRHLYQMYYKNNQCKIKLVEGSLYVYKKQELTVRETTPGSSQRFVPGVISVGFERVFLKREKKKTENNTTVLRL